MNSKHMNTDEAIAHLENEERRARIQEWITDDPSEKRKAREKQSSLRKLLECIKRMTGRDDGDERSHLVRMETPEKNML